MGSMAQKNSADIFSLHSTWDGRKLRRSLKRRTPLAVDFPETLQDIVDVIVIGKNGEMYSVSGVFPENSSQQKTKRDLSSRSGMLSEGLLRFFRHMGQGHLMSEKPGAAQAGRIALFPNPRKKRASKNKKTLYAFTPRELTILEFMKKGLSNKEIASALEISLYTVKDHIKRIMSKMDTHTRSGIVGKLAHN